MFFHLDEKTLADIIANQSKREKQASEKQPTFEYDGHVLKFYGGRDGSVVVDATPPLIKVVEGDKNAPHGDVDKLTPHGWVKIE
jgi:hypothetical protein